MGTDDGLRDVLALKNAREKNLAEYKERGLPLVVPNAVKIPPGADLEALKERLQIGKKYRKRRSKTPGEKKKRRSGGSDDKNDDITTDLQIQGKKKGRKVSFSVTNSFDCTEFAIGTHCCLRG